MRRKKIAGVLGATFVALIAATGYSVVRHGIAQPPVSSDVTLTGHTLADGYLQPVNPTWWARVVGFKVLNAQGQFVSIPRSRPVLFFAWWCPHCHAALMQLARTGELPHVTLISTYMNAGLIDGKTVAIRNVKDAQRITAASLAALHLQVPENHLLYLMPGTAQNALSIGVPDFVEHTRQGWYAMNGAPSNGAIWPLVMQEADDLRGGDVRG